jgi:hypothetical protein
VKKRKNGSQKREWGRVEKIGKGEREENRVEKLNVKMKERGSKKK